jgi:hypothetical protein
MDGRVEGADTTGQSHDDQEDNEHRGAADTRRRQIAFVIVGQEAQGHESRENHMKIWP